MDNDYLVSDFYLPGKRVINIHLTLLINLTTINSAGLLSLDLCLRRLGRYQKEKNSWEELRLTPWQLC